MPVLTVLEGSVLQIIKNMHGKLSMPCFSTSEGSHHRHHHTHNNTDDVPHTDSKSLTNYWQDTSNHYAVSKWMEFLSKIRDVAYAFHIRNAFPSGPGRVLHRDAFGGGPGAWVIGCLSLLASTTL